MKKYLKILLLITVVFFLGCSEENNERNVQFWTDKDLTTTGYNRIFIDGNIVGTFTESVSTAICGNSANIEFSFPTNSSIDISARNDDNDSLFLGRLSLAEFSSGLSVESINSSIGVSIKVEGTSSDDCTTVYLDWD